MATRVISAVYASDRFHGFDVRQRCQTFVNANDPIPITDDSFGDPDKGQRKYFAMSYSVDDGSPNFVGAREGETITVPTS
jgi:hypothetical protein